MRVLVTRPQPEAERTAQALARLGHSVLTAPMLVIAPVDAAFEPKRYSGVIMTSGNAARALAAHRARAQLFDLPLFAVGQRTAQAAREAGFASVTSADGDGADLVRAIASRGIGGLLLYLAGNDRARDLPGELAARGAVVETVVIYRADTAEGFPDPVRAALAERRIDGVLHYSRRTASIFCKCAETAGLADIIRQVTHYCLSPRVAEPLIAAGATAVHVAPMPDEDAIIGLLRSA